MNIASQDIKDMLVADTNLSLVFATDLFIGVEPTLPKNCVTIFDMSGRPPQLTLAGKGENYYYPSIQIRVRNVSYIAGWALIESIRTSLHGRAQETWNGTLYSVIYCSSGPAMLDWDDNSRVRFIINFDIQGR
jgi:hypothetical protein